MPEMKFTVKQIFDLENVSRYGLQVTTGDNLSIYRGIGKILNLIVHEGVLSDFYGNGIAVSKRQAYRSVRFKNEKKKDVFVTKSKAWRGYHSHVWSWLNFNKLIKKIGSGNAVKYVLTKKGYDLLNFLRMRECEMSNAKLKKAYFDGVERQKISVDKTKSI